MFRPLPADIREAVKPLVVEFLGEALEANIQAGRDRLDEFVTQKAPYYLPIIRNIGDDDTFVNPSRNDTQIDRGSHSRKYQTEQHLLEEGERLLNPDLLIALRAPRNALRSTWTACKA
ncbi:MAG: hypothetical protein AAF530_25885 [Pseudomonadota bacterium]